METVKKYDVVVAGYTCLDLIPSFNRKEQLSIKEFFIPGNLIELDDIAFMPGGSVPNVGIALNKFDKKVYLNGLIGDDIMGKALMELISRYKLDEGIKTTGLASTAFSIIISPPGVDRIFLEFTGCSKIFDESHINYDVVFQSSIFHFGYPPLLPQFYMDQGRELQVMFEKVHKKGVVTSVDFSLLDGNSASSQVRWKEILELVLPYIDICAPSLEEACQMVLPEQYTKIKSQSVGRDIIDIIPQEMVIEIAREMISYGARILLIKASHKGVYLFTADISSVNDKLGKILDERKWSHRTYFCDAFPLNQSLVKNSCGSGDVAIAALLAAILNGADPISSMKYAALAGRNNLYCNNINDDLADWKNMTSEMMQMNIDILEFSKLTTY